MSEPIKLYRTDNGEVEIFNAPSYAQSLVATGEYSYDPMKELDKPKEEAKAVTPKKSTSSTKAKSGKSK